MSNASYSMNSSIGFRKILPLIISLFFAWGFLTALNDVLVADLRAVFHLSYRTATLVQFTFFSSFFVLSFPAAKLVTSFGYRITMAIGLSVMSVASLGFIFAAMSAKFFSFLIALVVMASGSTILQTAAGPFVALLGTEESASSRFSLALAVNSLGAMLAPGFGAWLILRDTVHPQANDLMRPYLMIGIGLLCLGGIVVAAKFPAVVGSVEPTADAAASDYIRLLRQPKFTFGVATMFLYVGAEIGIGSLLINFLGQPDTTGLSMHRAAYLATLYMAGAMIGRFAGWIVLKTYRPQFILSIAAAIAVALVVAAVSMSGPTASFCLLAVGLCNSVMVPVIFTTAISGLGPLTGKGSGLLVAALIGGAVIPLAQGSLADHVGLRRSFLLPAACYLAIFAYSIVFLEKRRGNMAR